MSDVDDVCKQNSPKKSPTQVTFELKFSIDSVTAFNHHYQVRSYSTSTHPDGSVNVQLGYPRISCRSRLCRVLRLRAWVGTSSAYNWRMALTMVCSDLHRVASVERGVDPRRAVSNVKERQFVSTQGRVSSVTCARGLNSSISSNPAR